MEKFPEKLREARKSANLLQKELAYKAGIRSSSISRLEKGGRNPSADAVRRLALALGVTSDYLIGLSNNGEKE